MGEAPILANQSTCLKCALSFSLFSRSVDEKGDRKWIMYCSFFKI